MEELLHTEQPIFTPFGLEALNINSSFEPIVVFLSKTEVVFNSFENKTHKISAGTS